MNMDKQDLHGMAAIITGGSTDAAGAAALALAREGVQICLCGRQADLLELAAEKITALGGSCLTIVSELDSLEAAESLVEQARTAFGRLDILIMASPFWAGGQIHQHSVKTWERVLAANLHEPFLMARSVLPVFRAQQHGEIMALGSDSALGIYPQDGAFGVAMHALQTLMELIKVENAEYGIRTHTLYPGVTVTSGLDSEGKPALTAAHVADWVVWLLTRPAHLRGNGPILI
jgi:NAD(P)-dependent dehydrogenase (short-subunit alcohol dehydrogenase family)